MGQGPFTLKMPYEWDDMTNEAPVNSGAFLHSAADPPALRLTLWPHRSLPRRGFAWFILLTFAMLLIPLFALLGTLALWGLLPFLMGALGLMWYFLNRSYKDGELREDLSLWEDRVELARHNPRKPTQHWHANPHWVEVKLNKSDGPVENYITLRGNNRTVEIGAFLSPQERCQLYRRLTDAQIQITATIAP